MFGRIKLNIMMISLLLLTGVYSCRKFVTIDPPGSQLDQSVVFQTESSALSALASVYFKLSDISSGFASGSRESITISQGLYADELVSYLNNQSSSFYFYNNDLTPATPLVLSFWSNAYSSIYECNRIIEGINNSSNLTDGIKKQLAGEALFLRAFCHFYLVNLYGNIPLIITSDYTVNTTVSRTNALLVYQQIIADLTAAKELLIDAYPGSNRARVNKNAATALLARVYLYTYDYINAELNATEVIDKSIQYKLLTDLNKVFLRSSEEAIWQILPNGGSQHYTSEGAFFILKAPPTNFSLKNSLYNSFETDDQRRIKWTDSIVSSSGFTKWYFAYKYKENFSNATGNEYSMVLRLAEQYLIRAEARVKQDKLLEAKADIDSIRSRAGLPGTTAVTKNELITAIENERQHELFTEWGHRFFDLKRWKKLDQVLRPQKPNWNSTDSLLPLPQSQLLLNKNMTQNDGYN